MSSTMFQSRQKKTTRLLVDLHLPLGAEISLPLFFVYSTTIFEVAAVFGQKKKANLVGLLSYIFTQQFGC